MKKETVTTIIRCVLSAVLLAFIWAHDYWVTALAITLLFISNELSDFILGKLVDAWKRGAA